MLSDLSGIFRVDLRINPNQWYGNTAMLNPDGTPAATGQVGVTGQSGGQSGVNANAGANNANSTNNQPGAGRTAQPAQGQQQGTPRDPSMQPGDRAGSNTMNSASALNGAVSVRGYSEKRWTLGGHTLQETCIIPDLAAVVNDMNQAQTDDSAQANTAGRNAANLPGGNGAHNPATNTGDDDMDPGFGRPSMEAIQANRMFQGVSYLAFNPQTNAIVLTSMDSRQSDVMNATGQFLPGLNRVEFTVNSNSSQFGFGASQTGNPQDTLSNQSNPQHTAGNNNTNSGNPATNNPNTFNAQTDPNRPAASTPSTTGNNNNNDNPNVPNPNQPGNNSNNPSNRGTGNPANQTNPSNQTGGNQNAGNQTGSNTGNNQPNDPNRPPQTRDQNALNAGQGTTNSLNASAGAFDNVRVVLEFLSPEQHRVTLYRLNPGSNGDMYQNPYYVPQNNATLDANGRMVDAQGRLVDAQGRIVDFQGRVLDADGRPIDPNSNKDPNDPTRTNSNPATDPNNPNTRQPQPGDPNRPATNVPNDPSRPRVTGAAPATTAGQPPNTVTDTPRTRPNNAADPNTAAQPNNNNAQPGQPGQPGTIINQPGSNGANGTINAPGQLNNQFGHHSQNFAGNISAGDQGTWVVIWEATYTRVEGAQASRYRNYLQRADQLIQASIRDADER